MSEQHSEERVLCDVCEKKRRILGIVPVEKGIGVDYDYYWYNDPGEDHASAPQSVVGLAVVEETDYYGRVRTRLCPVVTNRGLLDENEPDFAGFLFESPDQGPRVDRQWYVKTYQALMGRPPEDLPC